MKQDPQLRSLFKIDTCSHNFSIYYNDNVFNDECLYASFFFYQQFFSDFGERNADITFFPIYRVFDNFVDRDTGWKEGEGARGSRIVVSWCQLENISAR